MLQELINSFLGKKKYYCFWEKIYKLSLMGMNVDCSGRVDDSGESNVFSYCAKMFGGGTIFDVGANQGQYAMRCLREMLGENIEIYSFEPSKKTFNMLQKIICEYPQIHAFNIGLSDNVGKQKLYFDRAGSGLASLYKRDLREYGINFDNVEEVELDTLDTFCEAHGINDIDLLKMDVEGNELKVLQGGSKMLNSGHVKSIQMEFGGCNIDSRTFVRDFWNMLNERYIFYHIMRDGFAEIKRYSERLEHFTNSNFFLVHR